MADSTWLRRAVGCARFDACAKAQRLGFIDSCVTLQKPGLERAREREIEKEREREKARKHREREREKERGKLLLFTLLNSHKHGKKESKKNL